MTVKPLILGAISIGAVAALAGCGSSSTSTSPTPTGLGGFSIPSIPGLPTLPGSVTGAGGGTGSGAGASTILTATDVQTISGDPNVAAVGGTCNPVTCIYADTTTTGGSGGIIVVEPIPGGLSQDALQAALASALSTGGVDSSGGTVTPVSGLGSAAIKEIDANSATYAFSKDNYFVVISITSATNTGADMDPQVQSAAETAAGQL
jgi:hypothetical protein